MSSQDWPLFPSTRPESGPTEWPTEEKRSFLCGRGWDSSSKSHQHRKALIRAEHEKLSSSKIWFIWIRKISPPELPRLETWSEAPREVETTSQRRGWQRWKSLNIAKFILCWEMGDLFQRWSFRNIWSKERFGKSPISGQMWRKKSFGKLSPRTKKRRPPGPQPVTFE